MDDKLRIIDANALIEDFKNDLINSRMEALRGNPHDSILIANVIERILDAPTIEAQPVKHGRWIKHRIDDPKSILHGAVKDTTCSVCGKSTPYNTEYCMHCGARMDGDSE